MTDFEKLKEVFLSLGLDLEKYKIDDFHYRCNDDIRNERFDFCGYYQMEFTVLLNEDYTIKKVHIGSWP